MSGHRPDWRKNALSPSANSVSIVYRQWRMIYLEPWPIHQQLICAIYWPNMETCQWILAILCIVNSCQSNSLDSLVNQGFHIKRTQSRFDVAGFWSKANRNNKFLEAIMAKWVFTNWTDFLWRHLLNIISSLSSINLLFSLAATIVLLLCKCKSHSPLREKNGMNVNRTIRGMWSKWSKSMLNIWKKEKKKLVSKE